MFFFGWLYTLALYCREIRTFRCLWLSYLLSHCQICKIRKLILREEIPTAVQRLWKSLPANARLCWGALDSPGQDVLPFFRCLVELGRKMTPKWCSGLLHCHNVTVDSSLVPAGLAKKKAFQAVADYPRKAPRCLGMNLKQELSKAFSGLGGGTSQPRGCVLLGELGVQLDKRSSGRP